MAQVKISDLSVGDWVGIDQADLNMPSDDLATAYIEKLRKPIRIKGISEDSDMVIADIEIVDEWGSIMMKCEHLRPIPITPEILDKNGAKKTEFVKDSGYEFYRCDDFYASRVEGSKWWTIVVLNECRDLVGCYIQHIHQLQHALRLAGVEKEIEL